MNYHNGKKSDRPLTMQYSIQRVVFFWMFFISLLAISLLTAYTMWIQYRNFRHEVDFLQTRFMDEQKKLLEQKVNESISFARFKAKLTDARLKTEIQSRVNEAWNVAHHLHETYQDQVSEDQIARFIKEALRPIRFKQGRGYYFIVSLDGVEELYPTLPQLEGQNLWDLTDRNGKFVIRDEIHTAKTMGQGFVTGYWPNPMISGDKGSLEYSFVKRFDPLKWLIGTGEFLDNVTHEVQLETLEWMTNIRYGNDSYIFVETYEGDALIMNGQILSPPLNTWDLEDPDGIKVIQEEIRIATQDQQGGFLTYSWKKLTGTEPVPVLSFVKAIPEWRWVVGSSVYMDDIQQAVETKREMLVNNVQKDSGLILLGLLASIPLIITAAAFISKKFNRDFDVFLAFFKSEERDSGEIPENSLAIKEFGFLAHATNTMIHHRRDAEKKLEILSRTDSLTGLPNRRDMENKIQAESARSQRNHHPYSFVMMDIDHFKSVNDSHGHDAGDEVLKNVARVLKESVREVDMICRWGGEEFLLLVPETGMREAIRIAEKIRKKIMAEAFRFQDQIITITITCGVSQADPGMNHEEVIGLADQYLLEGKRMGRNCTVPNME